MLLQPSNMYNHLLHPANIFWPILQFFAFNLVLRFWDKIDKIVLQNKYFHSNCIHKILHK